MNSMKGLIKRRKKTYLEDIKQKNLRGLAQIELINSKGILNKEYKEYIDILNEMLTRINYIGKNKKFPDTIRLSVMRMDIATCRSRGITKKYIDSELYKESVNSMDEYSVNLVMSNRKKQNRYSTLREACNKNDLLKELAVTFELNQPTSDIIENNDCSLPIKHLHKIIKTVASTSNGHLLALMLTGLECKTTGIKFLCESNKSKKLLTLSMNVTNDKKDIITNRNKKIICYWARNSVGQTTFFGNSDKECSPGTNKINKFAEPQRCEMVLN